MKIWQIVRQQTYCIKIEYQNYDDIKFRFNVQDVIWHCKHVCRFMSHTIFSFFLFSSSVFVVVLSVKIKSKCSRIRSVCLFVCLLVRMWHCDSFSVHQQMYLLCIVRYIHYAVYNNDKIYTFRAEYMYCFEI